MPLNVLVVDDSSIMRSMVIKSLRLSGLPLGDVHQAANGQEGLTVLDANWVDLLLIDLNMPVMTGEEMIDRLRSNEETSTIPILVISTEGSQTRIRSLRDKGAVFIQKPFTPEDLGQTVRRLTGVTDEQFDESFETSSDFDF